MPTILLRGFVEVTSSAPSYCLVTAVAANLEYFYRGLVSLLQARGVMVTGISSAGPAHQRLAEQGVNTIALEIARTPSPARDLWTLVRLMAHFSRGKGRYDLIVVSTPKAALLGALAAFLTGQRRRTVYVVRGRAYETMTGARRRIIARMDALACTLSAHVVVISSSLRDAMDEDGICARRKMDLFAKGSSKGVNLAQFDPTRVADEGRSLRSQLGIERSAIVVGYVGWLRKDKGTEELINAARRVIADDERVHLLLVGSWEDSRDPIDDHARRFAQACDRIHHLEWMQDPSVAFSAMDVFVFPTYREGFGNVAIEAAAMGLPVIASDVVGVRDAVDFDTTGVSVMPKDVEGLTRALKRLIDGEEARLEMGRLGWERVRAQFDERFVLGELCELLLSYAGRPST